MRREVPAIPNPPSEPATVARKPVGVQREQALRHWVPRVLIGLAIVGCGIYLIYYNGNVLGLTVLAFAATMGLVGLGIVIPTFLWIDRYEVEPARMLWGAFLWGALVATTVSMFLNEEANEQFGNGGLELAPVVYTIWAPVIEEIAKGAGLLALLWVRRREIDGIVDGIVYGGLIGVGFAFVENIQYLGLAFYQDQETLLWTFVGRVLLNPFAHSMFTVCTGIGFAIAVLSRRRLVQVGAPLLGLAFGMVLHGLSNSISGDEFLSRFIRQEIPIFIAFVWLLLWARRREGRAVTRELRAYVAGGWLAESEVAMLGSAKERIRARRWAKRVGGRPLRRQMVEFQEAGGGLAMVRGKLNRGIVDAQLLHEERLMLTLLAQRRTEIAQRTAHEAGESGGPGVSPVP